MYTFRPFLYRYRGTKNMLNQNKPRQSWTTSFSALKEFLEMLEEVRGDIPRSEYFREAVVERIERDGE